VVKIVDLVPSSHRLLDQYDLVSDAQQATPPTVESRSRSSGIGARLMYLNQRVGSPSSPVACEADRCIRDQRRIPPGLRHRSRSSILVKPTSPLRVHNYFAAARVLSVGEGSQIK
jgi:hypothetical protein